MIPDTRVCEARAETQAAVQAFDSSDPKGAVAALDDARCLLADLMESEPSKAPSWTLRDTHNVERARVELNRGIRAARNGRPDMAESAAREALANLRQIEARHNGLRAIEGMA